MNHQPFPFVIPVPWGGPPHPPPGPGQEVPARVRAAMAWLGQATQKTAVTVAANDVGFNETEGQKLEVEEREAVNAACKLLTAYFGGKYKPTGDEKREEDPLRGKGHMINCVSCAGAPQGRKACVLCQGAGTLLVFPAMAGQ